jgi:hypothetical protein
MILLLNNFPQEGSSFGNKSENPIGHSFPNPVGLESHSKNISLKSVQMNKDNRSFLDKQDKDDFSSRMNITTNGEFFEGFNLFVLNQNNESRYTENINRSLLVTDMLGNTLFSLENVHGPAKFINTTTILLGTSEGAALWHFRENEIVLLGFDGHHDYEYNPLNHTFFTFHSYEIEIEGDLYLFDRIVEFNELGEIVWVVDTRSFISITQWCPFNDFYGGARDITHSNTIFFDASENILYYMARNVNTFYKIDHKTGKVIWGLGEYGNFTLFDKDGKNRDSLFFHSHAVEKINENTFMLFDNDLHNQSERFNKRSRILEIKINETKMIAYESWSWTPSTQYFCNIWGDANKLPNGNRLATFGTFNHPDTDIGARIVEVNNEGDIVWEMNFPPDNDRYYGVYRTERFRFNPILDSPQDIKVLLQEKIGVTWQVWYNYRFNVRMKGSYTLYLNNQPINSSTLFFEKFWNPIDLTFNLGVLNPGIYNLTLVLVDESGQMITDNVNISIISSAVKSEMTYTTASVDGRVGGIGILISSFTLLYLLIMSRKQYK